MNNDKALELITKKVMELVNALGEDSEDQSYCAYVAFQILASGIAETQGEDQLNEYMEEIKAKLLN